MTQVRICHENSDSVVGDDFDVSGYARRLSGAGVEAMHANIGWQGLRHYNITPLFLLSKQCGGDMKRDEADIYAVKTALNIQMPANFTQGPVLDQLDWTLISAFKTNDILSTPDLMEFFGDYTPIFTVLLLLSIITVISVSRVNVCKKGKKRGKSRNHISIWLLICFLLGRYETRIKSKHVIFLLLLIVLANRMYAGMVMKTERMVKSPPTKLRSIQDVLRQKANFAWLSEAENEGYTKNSMFEKSIQVRKRNEMMGVNSSIFLGWDDRREFPKFLTGLYEQKHAVISRRFGSIEMHWILCALSLYHNMPLGKHRLLFSSIDGPHPFLGIVLSSTFVNQSPIYKQVIRQVRHAAEASLSDGLAKAKMLPTVVRHILPQHLLTEVKTCFAQIGDQQVSQIFTPDIGSMQALLITAAVVVAISTLVLLLENQ